MATNKNAQVRYQVLDRCFSNFNRHYTIEDLLDVVNNQLRDLYGEKSTIKLRQLREDIKHMKDRMFYNAPIETYPWEGRSCYYRYSKRGFTIFKNQLTVDEVFKLRSTIDMLGRYRGLPSNAWLEGVISNLECRFGLKGNQENLISFEQNEQLDGLEWLSLFINATTNHQVLSINYRTFKGHETNSLFHPYYMKQYNNRWFVFGLEEYETKSFISTKALDRVISVFATNEPFKANTTIDYNTYFDDIVGVTKPLPEVNKEYIVLRFSEQRYPYVTSKPIHKSQQIVSEDEFTISLDVRPNRELQQQLFSFGPDVEVLSPNWLREDFLKRIEENRNNYMREQNLDEHN